MRVIKTSSKEKRKLKKQAKISKKTLKNKPITRRSSNKVMQLACYLCGEILPVGSLLVHKINVHGEDYVHPKLTNNRNRNIWSKSSFCNT